MVTYYQNLVGQFEALVPGASASSIDTGCFINCGHYSIRRFPCDQKRTHRHGSCSERLLSSECL